MGFELGHDLAECVVVDVVDDVLRSTSNDRQWKNFAESFYVGVLRQLRHGSFSWFRQGMADSR